MIDFQCYHCGEILRIARYYAGKTGRCRHCGQSINIPAETEAPAPARTPKEPPRYAFLPPHKAEDAKRPEREAAYRKSSAAIGRQPAPQPRGAMPEVAMAHAFIEPYRERYEKAMIAMDTEARRLIQQGQEMRGVLLLIRSFDTVCEVHDFLSGLYADILYNLAALQNFGSKRLALLGHQPCPNVRYLENTGFGSGSIERRDRVVRELQALGLKRTHWYIPDYMNLELEYMLTVLPILIEPDFVPLDKAENQKLKESTSAGRYRSVTRGEVDDTKKLTMPLE